MQDQFTIHHAVKRSPPERTTLTDTLGGKHTIRMGRPLRTVTMSALQIIERALSAILVARGRKLHGL